ncbi:MAG: hypothetical protein GY796_29375 [Chloroflexi bacterium]|nr:hypothetical protein [Chloroflexota bacterium]
MIRRVIILSGIILLPFLGLTAVFFRSLRAAPTSPILIDAVLYDGYGSGSSDEAIRLKNVSGGQIDVTGWGVNDGESVTGAVISTTTILSPGQELWLANNGLVFKQQFGFYPNFEFDDSLPNIPNLMGKWPTLNNNGDQVILLDDALLVADCVAYEDNNGDDCGGAWNGAAISPYKPSSNIGVEGQILYRKRDQHTNQPVPDTHTAADWAQSTSDVVDGRKLLYPGWDLDTFFYTAQITETTVLTIAVAPDNAYEAIVAQINSAQHSLQIEALTFENLGLAYALLSAIQRGVQLTVLLEGEPPGGVPDQEKYICELLAAEGNECWFMFNDSDLDIYDRYTNLHAKFILIDGQRVIVSSENLSPNSLPYDGKQDGTWGRRGVVLITDAPGVIRHIQTVFDHDFDPTSHRDITGTAIIGSPPLGFVPEVETGGVTYTVRHKHPLAIEGTFAFEVVQSPENNLRSVDGLLGLINQAQVGDTVLVQQLNERPYWGATTSNPVDDPNLRLEAYIAAARRGASVRLLLDSYFDFGDATSNTATCLYVNDIAQTEQLDLVCKTSNPTGLGIHNKMVLVQVNGRGVIHIGSINGTEQSNKANRELALQVQSDTAYNYLAKMFFQDWGYKIYLPIQYNNYIGRATHLLISEILYDPPGIDDAEFIELVNPTAQVINIGRYSLGDAVNHSDFEDVRRFPDDTMINPGETLIIATTATAFFSEYGLNPDFEIVNSDSLVADLLDDMVWGDPNAILQLGNSGDEVILRDTNNQVVDVVTYGDGSYPGIISCNLVASSNISLERFPYWQDTDNCLVDFREWPFPNPGSLP